jgi:hypothetical protein
MSDESSLEIGGIKFTGGKMFLIITALSSAVGILYGGFEIYKRFVDMQEQIDAYVAPDLSELIKKVAVAEVASQKSVEYTNDMKTDLKDDIRHLSNVVDQVEKSTKQSQRETSTELQATKKDLSAEMQSVKRDVAVDMRTLKRETDDKIKKALDNPLNN